MTPEKMTLICNCQAMKARIDPDYSNTADFKNLESLSVEALRQLQDELIVTYNNVVRGV